MKKQILGLLLTFSATCFGSTAEKPSNLENKSIAAPELSQSQQQTELLTEQNKILLALLQLQYNAAVQAEKEKEHKSNRAIQAHKPWINKEPILQAGSQKNAFYDQEENIFYDQTDSFFRHPAVVEKILDLLELSIDKSHTYLWPTIRSIIIHKIATKVSLTAFEGIDNLADKTVGIRPIEFLSLSKDDYDKNTLLRTEEIASLVAKRDKLKTELSPAETKIKAEQEIAQLSVLLSQAKDSELIDLLTRKNALLQKVAPQSSKEKLKQELRELQETLQRQEYERAAAQTTAAQGTVTIGSSSRPGSRPSADPATEVD